MDGDFDVVASDREEETEGEGAVCSEYDGLLSLRVAWALRVSESLSLSTSERAGGPPGRGRPWRCFK